MMRNGLHVTRSLAHIRTLTMDFLFSLQKKKDTQHADTRHTWIAVATQPSKLRSHMLFSLLYCCIQFDYCYYRWQAHMIRKAIWLYLVVYIRRMYLNVKGCVFRLFELWCQSSDFEMCTMRLIRFFSFSFPLIFFILAFLWPCEGVKFLWTCV